MSNPEVDVSKLCLGVDDGQSERAREREPKAAFHPPPTCATSLSSDLPALCALHITIRGELLIVMGTQSGADRDTGSPAAARVISGARLRSMSVGSARLSPSERVDPGD